MKAVTEAEHEIEQKVKEELEEELIEKLGIVEGVVGGLVSPDRDGQQQKVLRIACAPPSGLHCYGSRPDFYARLPLQEGGNDNPSGVHEGQAAVRVPLTNPKTILVRSLP